MQKISSNVYVETDFLGCTPGFVVTREGIVMIDAPQKPSEAVSWRNLIMSKGKVRYIINTDHHGDHTMGNGFYSGVVVAHHGTRSKFATTEEFLERGRIIDPRASSLMKQYQAKKPTLTFDTSANIYLGEHTFELIHTPGHTENTLAVFVPEERVLFTGDNVCTEGFPDLSVSDLAGWLRSLAILKQIRADVVVPGHRHVGDAAVVERFEKNLRDLIRRVRDARESGAPREEIPNIITYPDKIHERYPKEMRDKFGDKPKASVLHIYDTLAQAPLAV